MAYHSDFDSFLASLELNALSGEQNSKAQESSAATGNSNIQSLSKVENVCIVI